MVVIYAIVGGIEDVKPADAERHARSNWKINTKAVTGLVCGDAL